VQVDRSTKLKKFRLSCPSLRCPIEPHLHSFAVLCGDDSWTPRNVRLTDRQLRISPPNVKSPSSKSNKDDVIDLTQAAYIHTEINQLELPSTAKQGQLVFGNKMRYSLLHTRLFSVASDFGICQRHMLPIYLGFPSHFLQTFLTRSSFRPGQATRAGRPVQSTFCLPASLKSTSGSRSWNWSLRSTVRRRT